MVMAMIMMMIAMVIMIVMMMMMIAMVIMMVMMMVMMMMVMGLRPGGGPRSPWCRRPAATAGCLVRRAGPGSQTAGTPHRAVGTPAAAPWSTRATAFRRRRRRRRRLGRPGARRERLSGVDCRREGRLETKQTSTIRHTRAFIVKTCAMISSDHYSSSTPRK